MGVREGGGGGGVGCGGFFFFNDTATTEIYTLSLHDALPISLTPATGAGGALADSLDKAIRVSQRRSQTQ